MREALKTDSASDAMVLSTTDIGGLQAKACLEASTSKVAVSVPVVGKVRSGSGASDSLFVSVGRKGIRSESRAEGQVDACCRSEEGRDRIERKADTIALVSL
eukprot:754457-Hanusia_phi.AAC.2